jgi:hypothetical protein
MPAVIITNSESARSSQSPSRTVVSILAIAVGSASSARASSDIGAAATRPERDSAEARTPRRSE